MLLNFVDMSVASTLKPTRMVATITPAMSAYSSAVTARRSAFSAHQAERYWIMYVSLWRLLKFPAKDFFRSHEPVGAINHGDGFRKVSLTGPRCPDLSLV